MFSDYLCYQYIFAKNQEQLNTNIFLVNVWKKFKNVYLIFSAAFKDVYDQGIRNLTSTGTFPYIHYELVDGCLRHVSSDNFNQTTVWAEAVSKIWQGYCEMDFLYSAKEEESHWLYYFMK